MKWILVSLVLICPPSLSSPLLNLGDKCSSSNVTMGECDPSMPLQCSPSSRCVCKGGYTINRNGTKCLEVGGKGLESDCEETIQCWKGPLGRLSECNPKTAKCTCYHSDTLPIVFHEGRCYYGESVGDYCQVEGLCEATTRNAQCRGTCQCAEGFVGSWDKSRCLPIATQGLESPCEENVQCEKSPLGALSQCNQVRMRCECYSIPIVPTLFHNSKCYFGAALGDVCEVDPQCEALTPGSSCSKEGKCGCGAGQVRNEKGTLCLQIPSADGSSQPDVNNCVEDVQCQKALGPLGRCSPLHKQCECGGNETWTVVIGGKCLPSNPLGQPCKVSRQCSGRTENSRCYDGLCECVEGSHVPSSDYRKCLPVAHSGLHAPCDEDDQCREGPLGPLSHCSPLNKSCECSDILPVVLHSGRCYFHRPRGSPCSSHFECKAEVDDLSRCLNRTCVCTTGRLSNNNLCINNASQISPNLFLSIFIISIISYNSQKDFN